MRIGFTGTQQGMTKAQKKAFSEEMANLLTDDSGPNDEFHHGDCVGADDDADEILAPLVPNDLTIVIHPPDNPIRRAHCDWRGPRHILRTYPYITRNKHIVEQTEKLIACPGQKEEQFNGSGTWSTIRYARYLKLPLLIIYPDGSTAEQNV